MLCSRSNYLLFLPNFFQMDLKGIIFVLLLVFSFGEAKGGKGTARTNEPTPSEKVKQEIQQLIRDDPLLMVEEFEKITRNIATQLEQDERIETDVVTVTTHEFDLGSTTDSRFLLNIVDIHSKSRVEIPTHKIKMTPRGKSAHKLTVVTAWWKNVSTLPIPKMGLLPQNTTAVTVTYFLDLDKVNESKESLPVDYYIDIARDFTHITELKPNERLRGLTRTCAWLDLSTNLWSEHGCVATYNELEVNCVCNHTTTFVTLLMLDTYEPLSYEVRVATLVFEITSIVCLVVTILFICVARHGAGIDSTFSPQATGLKANRTNSQVSLCFSVLCMHVVIVASEVSRSTNDAGCVVVTVLTHYFLLSSAFWSFCEGIGIFVKVCPLLTMKVRYRTMTIIQAMVGWIVPFLITISTAAYGIQHGTYMDETLGYKMLQNRTGSINNTLVETPQYEECWLSKENGMVWAALGPLIVIVTVNIAILCYIVKEVVKMNRNHPCRDLEMSDSQNCGYQSNTLRRGTTPTIVEPSEPSTEVQVNATTPSALPNVANAANKRKAKYMVSITRSFGVLMPILAIPWILSILANIPNASLVLGTAHAVINGLQGFQIFLLYCVVNKKGWRIVKRKWRNCELVRLFSKYRYNRRDSVSANNNRIIYEPKRIQSRVDSNGNAYLHPGWKSQENAHHYDTLSSCRSSSGTINSTQSRQSLLKKSSKWWKR